MRNPDNNDTPADTDQEALLSVAAFIDDMTRYGAEFHDTNGLSLTDTLALADINTSRLRAIAANCTDTTPTNETAAANSSSTGEHPDSDAAWLASIATTLDTLDQTAGDYTVTSDTKPVTLRAILGPPATDMQDRVRAIAATVPAATVTVPAPRLPAGAYRSAVAFPGDPDLDFDIDRLTLTAVISDTTTHEILVRGTGGHGTMTDTATGKTITFTPDDPDTHLDETTFAARFPHADTTMFNRYVAVLEQWRDAATPLHVCAAPGRQTTLIENTDNWLPFPRRSDPASSSHLN